MEKQNHFQLLQDFLMREEKIQKFICEDDTTNIIRVAPAIRIGLIEFDEIPGESAGRSGREPWNVVYYKNDPDMEAEPEIWARETFAGTVIRFTIRPGKGAP